MSPDKNFTYLLHITLYMSPDKNFTYLIYTFDVPCIYHPKDGHMCGRNMSVCNM